MISKARQRRVDYERRRMAQHDAASLREDSLLEGKRLGMEEGLRLGMEEGLRLSMEEGLRLGVEECLRSGWVEALLIVLHARKLPCSEKLRARIDAEMDLARLNRWVARAATAASAEEVLAD